VLAVPAFFGGDIEVTEEVAEESDDVIFVEGEFDDVLLVTGMGVVEGVGEEGFKEAGMMGVPAGRLLLSGIPLQIFQEVSPNPPKMYLCFFY
jgi:hypothetical protein